MAHFNFKTADAPAVTMGARSPLPPGKYECMVTNSDIRATKSGTGEFIELEIQVISGEHSGRRLWERLNVNNQNEKAEQIARAALGPLCSALGVEEVTDTEQLHDKPFLAGIEIDRKEPDRNRIMAYYPANRAAPAAQKPAAPAPAAGGARPWAR